MIVRTCISRKYVLSQEEEGALRRAVDILDSLYAYSLEDGKWEKDFREIRDSLDFLLEETEFNGGVFYWREDDSEEEQAKQTKQE